MVCIFSGNCISIGPPPVVAQDNKGVKRLHNGNAMIISIFFWSNYLIIWKKGVSGLNSNTSEFQLFRKGGTT
jgi:hypothetical protein